jgi:hypothetical protein
MTSRRLLRLISKDRAAGHKDTTADPIGLKVTIPDKLASFGHTATNDLRGVA